MLKVGREEPAVSMDVNGGKIIWARHSELQLANLKKVDAPPDAKGDTSGVKDGEILSVEVKDMGSCEIYPQSIAHNPNGRLVSVLDYSYTIRYATTHYSSLKIIPKSWSRVESNSNTPDRVDVPL